MIRRLLPVIGGALAIAVSAPATGATPQFASPTTTTTTVPQLAAPTSPSTYPTTTTTTTTVWHDPTTTSPRIATETTTTTEPRLAAETTTTTAAPEFAAPTTTAPPVATVAVPTEEVDTAGLEPLDPADVPLGQIDTSSEAPDDLDITVEPTCANQCIKSGVFHPRGFGAMLDVETYVEAELTITIVEDLESDGGEDGLYYANYTTSGGGVTEFSWALDDLEPGQTYDVQVHATDENGDTAEASGQFTTLSQRTVNILVHAPAVTGGPTNVIDTDVWLRVADLSYNAFAPPASIGPYYSLPDNLDLAVLVFRMWSTSQYTLCEGYGTPDWMPPQGDDDALCGSWNTATIDNLALDQTPGGQSRWSQVTIERTLSTPGGCGTDPRCFNFTVVVNITVQYS